MPAQAACGLQSRLTGLAELGPIAALFGGGEKLSTEYSNFHQLKALDNASHEVNFQDLDGQVHTLTHV